MRRTTRTCGVLLAVLLMVLAPSPADAAAPPRCGPSIAPADAPTNGNSAPPVAPSYFAADFPVIKDSRHGFPVGGFGGLRRGAALHHTPVVFVHGNQADGQNWLSAMLQFQRDAGYSMQEMFALSYNGLGNYYGGAPSTATPTAEDQDYVRQNPTALGNGGHGAANEDEVPDLCRFVEAVQAYTGSQQVDIVAHSLGVTITREMMRLYPSLARDVVAVVGIAGANHGTTVCRGLESSYYGCDEIAPGTPWLARLNAQGEAPGPTTWQTVSNGLEGDPFFVGPDEGSPQLAGADNRTFPGDYHNDLRVLPAEVDAYLAFLLRHGQAGPGADPRGTARAAALERSAPDGRTGRLCGVEKLTGPQPSCPGVVPAPVARTTVTTPTVVRATRPHRALAATGSGGACAAVGVGLLALLAVRRRQSLARA